MQPDTLQNDFPSCPLEPAPPVGHGAPTLGSASRLLGAQSGGYPEKAWRRMWWLAPVVAPGQGVLGVFGFLDGLHKGSLTGADGGGAKGLAERMVTGDHGDRGDHGNRGSENGEVVT